MKPTRYLSAFVMLVSLPATAGTPDAQTILSTMHAKQIERWQGVDRYTVEQTVMGTHAQLYYERITVTDRNAQQAPAFRLVPPAEAAQRSQQAHGQRSMTPDEMRQYADAMEMTGQAVSDEVDAGMKAAGLPPGLLQSPGSEPWLSADPGTMMSGNAAIFRTMADGVEQQAAADNSTLAAQQEAAANVAVFDRARLIGVEQVDGRPAFHLRADGLNQKQKAGDRDFTVQSVDLWVDKTQYVALRSKVEGIATSATETTPMIIEQSNSEYRAVPGSSMYEPYKRVMRMTGVIDAKQQKEMAEARRQMAEFEQQLAAMPPAQRQMVTNQMGPQLAMMRNMAAGGGFEIATTIDEIRIGEFPDAESGTTRVLGTKLPTATTPATVAASDANHAAPDPAARHAAQQACLQQKVRDAEAAKKQKRGLGSLFGAIARTASRYGVADLNRASSEIYNANATADDVATAAKDLGLTEDDVAACRDPH